MCAKTYVEPTKEREGFDLYDEYDKFIEKLRSKEFETIQSSAVLQAVSAILTNKVDKTSILSINKMTLERSGQSALNQCTVQ